MSAVVYEEVKSCFTLFRWEIFDDLDPSRRVWLSDCRTGIEKVALSDTRPLWYTGQRQRRCFTSAVVFHVVQSGDR